MSKNTIGGKLKHVKTYQAQERALAAWAENWQHDQENVIARLRIAAVRDDHGTIMHMIDQLQGLTDKRFGALHNVACIVSNPQRQLMDRPDDVPDATINVVDNPPVMDNQAPFQEPVSAPAPAPRESLPRLIIQDYKRGKDINDISIMRKVSFNKVVKILVTAGLYHSETYDKIQDMRDAGMPDDDICAELKIEKSSLDKYTPYKKGMYLSENPTENALRIRRTREKQDVEE